MDVHFVTMADVRYEMPLRFCLYQMRKLHPEVPIRVYDLGGLPKDLYAEFDVRWLPLSNRDPRAECNAAIHALDHILKEDARPFFFGADVFLLQRIDEVIEDHSYDLGLTIRPEDERRSLMARPDHLRTYSLINAGSIFFGDRQEVNQELVYQWAMQTWWKNDFYQQPALGDLAAEAGVIDEIGSVGVVRGARIKSFSVETYNNYLPGSEETAKIIHLKGSAGQFESLPAKVQQLTGMELEAWMPS